MSRPRRQSRHLQVQLDISHLKLIRDALKENGVSDAKWYDLGVELEVPSSKLKQIKIDHPGDSSHCLLECLEAWLELRSRTWGMLDSALRKINETAAKNIRESYGDPASQLLQQLYKKLSEKISFSEEYVEMFYKEGLITKDGQDMINAWNGFLNFDSLKEIIFAVAKDHEKLRKFGNILVNSEDQQMLVVGEELFKNFKLISPCSVSSIHEPMFKDALHIDKGIHINEAYEADFDEFRVKSANTREQIANSIYQCNHPSCSDLKIYLSSCLPELKNELEDVTDVKSVMTVVKLHCTIINIVPMEIIADHFNLDGTKILIKQYNESLDSFCSEVKLMFVLDKDLCPDHQSSVHNEINFILDWNPVDHKLQDIRRLLEKAFKAKNNRVIVKRIREGSSIIVLCFAPNILLHPLYLEAQKNVTALIQEFSLVQLKIGKYTVYDKIMKDKEVNITIQDLEIMQEEKFDEKTELVFPLERLYIKTSELLNNADQKMMEILRKMTDERTEVKEIIIQSQIELREAKENIKEITELKRRIDEHDKILRVMESRDHHRGILQVPAGRRNPSIESGYGSRSSSIKGLQVIASDDDT